MTSECERFEVEIGMREHGALDATDEAALDAHLATCSACRSFAAAARDADVALRRQAESDVGKVDWTRLRARVSRIQRGYRLKLWLAPIFLLQVPLIALLSPAKLPRELLVAGPFATLAIVVAYVWLIGRPFRELVAVVQGGDDLLRGYLRELRRQRLRARVWVAWNLAVAVTCAACAFLFPEVRAYASGCALLFAGWATYDLAFKLPRLHRALAESSR